jgi:hypothetical protein
MPWYGCANFWGGDDDAKTWFPYEIELALWLMQYQDDEQGRAVVDQHSNMAQHLQPGGWRIAYLPTTTFLANSTETIGNNLSSASRY